MKVRGANTDARARLRPAGVLTPGGRAGRKHAGLRVLLVEDNEDHVILARRALESRGHGVTAVVGARAAMSALAGGEYDAVALDYQLPDSTGLDALETIRRRKRGLPVVMVTAWGSEQVAVEALKKGAKDYVVKGPGYERELVRALELSAEKASADASEQALRAELERRARTDCLTSLLNRGEMERVLKREIRRASRQHRVFSFVSIDVDDFKAINDTHGHSAGDSVLCRIGRILRQSTRASDFVARWGGDEFAVLLAGAGLSAARAFADRVSRLVSRVSPASPRECPAAVKLSAGVACATRPVSRATDVLKWADRALYAAKVGGGNQARFCVLGEGERASVASCGPPALVAHEGENRDAER